MIRKILHIALYLAFPACAVLLLSFATENHQRSCTHFEVRVDQSGDLAFLSPEQVEQMVIREFDTLTGQAIPRGKLPQIRQFLLSNPYVERAAVYLTLDGGLFIEVKQRAPMLRVINTRNQSFYIDHAGKLIPPSRNYTPRVMVATGHIRAEYSPGVDLNIPADPLAMPDSEKGLRELYELATSLCKDPFWHAFIDQVYVTPRGEFELIPKNGAHTIEFGRLGQVDEKLDKLLFFYRHGIGQVGWSYYNRINIKYNNQIVCSK
jgi:cell division protein FtsQ